LASAYFVLGSSFRSQKHDFLVQWERDQFESLLVKNLLMDLMLKR
jgi:hypothetical protein